MTEEKLSKRLSDNVVHVGNMELWAKQFAEFESLESQIITIKEMVNKYLSGESKDCLRDAIEALDLLWKIHDMFEKPIHAHPAYFGSELACDICNPNCHEKHLPDNPNYLQWCGDKKCPMNPKRWEKK